MSIANGSNLDATDLLVEHNADGTLKSKDCRAYHNANQALASGAWASAALNSERFDTDTIHDTVTNNSRLTCKTAGKYLIGGCVGLTANATGWRGVRIYLNGTTVLVYSLVPASSATYQFQINLVTLWSLAVNDYVELQVFQDSGISLNILNDSSDSPELWAVRVGT